MTLIEKAFQQAVCIEIAKNGDEIECGCGQKYPGTDTGLGYGTFAGHVIVQGCPCPSSSSFAGMLWAHRHATARFLRGMGEALRRDTAEVDAMVPRALGEEQS